MKKINRFLIVCVFFGMGVWLKLITSVYAAVPTITTIEGKSIGPETIYLNITSNVTLDGTADAGNTVTVWMDGSQVTTFPAPVIADGSYGCDITDSLAIGVNLTVEVRAFDGINHHNSSSQNILIDITPPDIPTICWQNPSESISHYVGPNLSRVWTVVNDTGGSGIDWTLSTLTVSGISGSNSNNGADEIDFNPTSGFGSPPFTDTTLYTLTATIYDRAQNVCINTDQFRYDNQPPQAAIQWRYPYRDGMALPAPDPRAASFYMGEDLTRIWADLNPTVTETFGDAIDYAATTISVGPAIAGSGEIDGGHIIDLTVPAVPYEGNFSNGQIYTITVIVKDLAGNSSTYFRQFMKDKDPPVIGNVEISDIAAPDRILNGNDRVIRGETHFPKSPDNFTSYITDTKGSSSDWGGHTSLNGNGISYHSYEASEMRLYHETGGEITAGVTNTYTNDSGTIYWGFLTIPNTYSTSDGVYSISVCARDWANYDNHHRDLALPRFLVDDTPPLETDVLPTQGPYHLIYGETYMKTYDLTAYPKKVSVVAQDTPADRNVSFPDCGFPDRLNMTLSTVTLLNPDNNSRALAPSNNNWTHLGTDLNYNFTADINQTDPPWFPIPEYIGNTIEGRYTIRIHMEDVISNNCGLSNKRDVDYYFFNDITPPRLISFPFSTIPLSNSYTSNFSDVQVTIMDPDLRTGADGTFPGSGLNLIACAVEIYAGLSGGFWDLGLAETTITSAGPFAGPQDQALNGETVDVFKVWNVDEQVRDYYGYEESEYNPGRKIFTYKTSTQVNPTDGSISISGLEPSARYVIGWKIPATYSHDGSSVIGTIPNEAVIKNGFYFANCFVADMVGNTSQVESIYFSYLSAGGVSYLTADPHVILADGVSESVITSGPIYLSDSPGTLVQDGTLVTVSASLGEIITPDADVILPGIQVMTSSGVATFVVRSRPSEPGKVTLRAWTVSGFADSGEVTDQLEIILAKIITPLISSLAPQYSMAHSQINLFAKGKNFDGISAIRLKNSSQTVIGSVLDVTDNSLTAWFSLPAVPGLFDLVLSKGTFDFVFKTVFTLLSPMSGPVQWRISDLGKAGNPPEPGPSGIAIGDADHDNQAEVYVANNEHMLFKYKKTSTWNTSFLPEVSGSYFNDLLIADANHDGDWEIIGACSEPLAYQYQAEGAGWNANSICAVTGPLAVGDGNNDGLVDVYAVSMNASADMSIVQALTNSPVAAGLETIFCLLAGDGDNDQADEIYAANQEKRIFQFKYNGSGWDKTIVAIIGNGDMKDLVLGDLDKDGDNELYGANEDKNIYQFKCTGLAWSSKRINTLPGACQALAISDGDNDGHDEIYVACADGHVYQLKLNGTQWQQQDLGNAGTPLLALAVGDGDNNFQFEVYAVGENAHVYQFQAKGSDLTPTPTITPISIAPDKFLKIYQSRINPTRGEEARITWCQPQNGPVTIIIYNMLGEKVATLADQREYPSGQYNEITWRGITKDSRMVGSGIYIVHIKAGQYQDKAKICVVK